MLSAQEIEKLAAESRASGSKARKIWSDNFNKKYIIGSCVKGCEKQRPRFWIDRAMLRKTESKFCCVWCGTEQLYGDNKPPMAPATMLTVREGKDLEEQTRRDNEAAFESWMK